MSACAPVISGTEPLGLSPALAASSHVGVVRMSSDWVRAEEDFTDTFTDSVLENLRECARGPNRLDVNIHVFKVRREGRLQSLFQGGGEHELNAVAELIEPGSKRVVGRYPIHVVVDAGGPAEILLADRQLMVSDAFATELCRQAFAR